MPMTLDEWAKKYVDPAVAAHAKRLLAAGDLDPTVDMLLLQLRKERKERNVERIYWLTLIIGQILLILFWRP